MATDPSLPTTPPPASVPAPCPANLGWSMIWGGMMLVVLTLWLRAKFFDELPFLVLAIVGFLGAYGIGSGAWILISCLRGKTTPELAVNQRHLGGLLCLAAGGIMLLVAVALWFLLRLAGFGEYVGLAIFGLVAIFTGRSLLRTETVDPDVFWQNFRARIGAAKMTLFVLGAVQLLAFVLLAFW